MEKKRFRTLLRRTIAIPVLMMALLAGAFLWEASDLKRSMRSVDYTDRVLDQSSDFMKHLLDMETGLRGYLITGDSVFLQPYNESLKTVDADYQHLYELVSDNPEQQGRLREISNLYHEWVHYSAQMVALRTRTKDSYSDLNLNLRGKNTMDALRQQIAGFDLVEKDLRRQRNVVALRRWHFVIFNSIALGSLLTILLGLFVRSRMHALAFSFQRSIDNLAQSEQRWATTLASIGDAVISTDVQGKISFLNEEAESLTGWKREDALGKSSDTIFVLEDESTKTPLESPIAQAIRSNQTVGVSNHAILIARDGSRVPIDDSSAPIRDNSGKMTGVVLVFRDITERRKKEEQLRTLNRTMRAIGDSNQALLHATTEEALLKRVCEIISQVCGYSMVWIGYVEHDDEKTVQPVAYSGFDEGYLNTLQITWADTERGRGPTGLAVRTGRPCTCQNMLTDPAFEPWRAEALKRGYASSLVLPILGETGKPFAVITIYASVPNAFFDDEIRLLESLAADLGYGISTIRLRLARLQAERALREHREWLRVTLSSIGDAVLATDLNGQIVFLNPVASSLTAWKPEEAQGQPIESVFPIVNEQTRKPAENIVARVLKEGRMVELANHTALCARDGREIPIEDSAAPIFDTTGKVVGVVLVFHDVTAKRHAQKEIQRRNAVLTAIGRIFEGALQCETEEQLGQACLNVVNELTRSQYALIGEIAPNGNFGEIAINDPECVFGVPENKNGNRNGSANFRIGALCKPVIENGRSILINAPSEFLDSIANSGEHSISTLMATPLLSAGRVVGIIAVANYVGRYSQEELQSLEDLSPAVLEAIQRKRAERALLRSEKLASVGRMAASIAHEINNPLEAVVNSLYLARTNLGKPDSALHYLEIADDELKRISHITRQTLGFYREASIPRTVRVSSILEAAIELVKRKFETRQIEIDQRFERDFEINAVAGEMRQVFSNLLMNSLDAIGEQGRVALRISESTCQKTGQRRTRVSIADNGKGIDDSTRPHIFEPLFTTKEATGSGLGLWVSKQLIEKHGGIIRVRSCTKYPHRGTVFSVFLPVAMQGAAASES